MNDQLLIFLFIVGIAFIVFGILILFLPEVIEGKDSLNKTPEKKRKIAIAWWLNPRVWSAGAIVLMVAIITLAVATRVPSGSSSSTSGGSSSLSSSTSQTLSSNTTTSVGSSETESSADVISSSSEVPSSSMILFTVTFNAMEGSPVNAEVIYDGGLIPTPPLTERTGYTFDGWYRSEDNGVTLGDSWNFALDSVTSDLTLYAKWTINTYYISFVNYVGGLNIPSRYVVYQAIPTPPTQPTRFGYTFGGWYLEPECINQYTFTDPMPANNFALYAKWTPNVYTMTFYTNGAAAIDPITADFGTNVNWPGDITKDDSRFGGWFSNSIFSGNAITQTTMPGYNLNAYARWYRLFTKIYVGSNYSFGVAPSGNIYSWGANSYGQLGNGTTAIRQNTPTLFTIAALNEGETILNFYLADLYGFAMTSEGRFFTWGETPNGRFLTPTLFTIGVLNVNETITSVHTNAVSNTTFFITSENRIFVQGSNIHGQLGRGTSGPSAGAATPVLISIAGLNAGEVVERFSIGAVFSLAITSQNRIFGTGENRGGQIGNGTTTGQNSFVLSDTTNLNGETIDFIQSGREHTFLITASGKIFAWGVNTVGTGSTYGNGTSDNVLLPTEMVYSFLNVGETIVELEVGSLHNYVRTSAGRLFAWGFGGEGRLANGGNAGNTVPTAFTTPSLDAGETIVNIISAPGPVSYLITSTNRTLAWGRGMDGQIGDGDTNMFSATAVKNTPIFI